MKLTSNERRQLADFITTTTERQAQMLRTAMRTPSTPAPLIRAMQAVLNLI